MDSQLKQAVYRILLPLVRILVRKGVAFGEFSQLVKRAYVEVAEASLVASEGKATTSRIAIVTGLTRKDTAQLRKFSGEDDQILGKYNRSVRVIGGWLEDKDFITPDGKPRVLPLNGENGFEALVARYSGDMPTKAMLDELQRVGVVEKLDGQYVNLLRHAYIPVGDEGEKLVILGSDVALLISTIDHNLQATPDHCFFQRKVAYDRLPEECLPTFKKLVNKHGQLLLERLNEFLAVHDLDRAQDDVTEEPGETKYAGVGIYYFEDDASPEKTSKSQGHED
ncbi:MAG: DUF6502 family protein [bacterium]